MEIKTWQDLKVGDRCKVFDADSWTKTGDVGDNSQFWLEAEIISERGPREGYNNIVIDVQFDDGRISEGHYKNMVMVINH